MYIYIIDINKIFYFKSTLIFNKRQFSWDTFYVVENEAEYYTIVFVGISSLNLILNLILRHNINSKINYRRSLSFSDILWIWENKIYFYLIKFNIKKNQNFLIMWDFTAGWNTKSGEWYYEYSIDLLNLKTTYQYWFQKTVLSLTGSIKSNKFSRFFFDFLTFNRCFAIIKKKKKSLWRIL